MVSTVLKNTWNGFRRLFSPWVTPGFKHLEQLVEKFCHGAVVGGRPGTGIGLRQLHRLGNTLPGILIIGILESLHQFFANSIFHLFPSLGYFIGDSDRFVTGSTSVPWCLSSGSKYTGWRVAGLWFSTLVLKACPKNRKTKIKCRYNELGTIPRHLYRPCGVFVKKHNDMTSQEFFLLQTVTTLRLRFSRNLDNFFSAFLITLVIFTSSSAPTTVPQATHWMRQNFCPVFVVTWTASNSWYSHVGHFDLAIKTPLEGIIVAFAKDNAKTSLVQGPLFSISVL